MYRLRGGSAVKRPLGLFLVTAAILCGYVSVALAESPPHALDHAGIRACRTAPQSSRHACFALWRLMDHGYSMIWQTTQAIRVTQIVTSHRSRSIRTQFARDAYHVLHAFVGTHGWQSGVSPFPSRPRAEKWYDDDAWVGDDLALAYNQTHWRYLRTAAEEILKFERTGLWRKSDPRDQHHHPGGIYWNQKRRFRSTVTNSGAIQLALLIYSETHKPYYLDFAKRLYAWTRSTLGTKSGRYRSQIGPNGVISGSAFLPWEAIMASNGIALNHYTHLKKYLVQAEQTAKIAGDQYPLSKIEKYNPVYDAMYFSNSVRFSGTVLDAYAAYVHKLLAPKTALVHWRTGIKHFPRRDCIPSFHCRQEQMAQAGVFGAMALSLSR